MNYTEKVNEKFTITVFYSEYSRYFKWRCLFAYSCDRQSRAACAQSVALWQQAKIEFACDDHSIIACSPHILYMYGVVLHAHPVRGEPHI